MSTASRAALRKPSAGVPLPHTSATVSPQQCACGGSSALSGKSCNCGDQSTPAHELSRVPSIVDEALRSPGEPLDPSTQHLMAARFGHDFSRVRVHADAKAAVSARTVNALAYTAGWDVVFGEGKYAPSTREGKELLAHELSHVAQQQSVTGMRQSAATTIFRAVPDEPAFSDSGAGSEAQAGAPPAIEPSLQAHLENVYLAVAEIMTHYETKEEGWIEGVERRAVDALDYLSELSTALELRAIQSGSQDTYQLKNRHSSDYFELKSLFDSLANAAQPGLAAEVIPTTAIGQMIGLLGKLRPWWEALDLNPDSPVIETVASTLPEAQQEVMPGYQEMKDAAYQTLIDSARAARETYVNFLRDRAMSLPADLQPLALAVVDIVEIDLQVLSNLFFFELGAVVGFVEGFAGMVLGFMEILRVAFNFVMAMLGSPEDFGQDLYAIELAWHSLYFNMVEFLDSWLTKFSAASQEERALMVGEFVGQLSQFLVTWGAGSAKLGKLLPPPPAAAPQLVAATAGGGAIALPRAVSTTVDIAQLGPPLGGLALPASGHFMNMAGKRSDDPSPGSGVQWDEPWLNDKFYTHVVRQREFTKQLAEHFRKEEGVIDRMLDELQGTQEVPDELLTSDIMAPDVMARTRRNLRNAYRKLSEKHVNEAGAHIHSHTRSNGYVVRFNEGTGEFSVVSPAGDVQAYFIPQNGLQYYLNDRESNL